MVFFSSCMNDDLPFCPQKDTIMRDAALGLDANRSHQVRISIPGLTEPQSYYLVLNPAVFLCLADQFTYSMVSVIVWCNLVSSLYRLGLSSGPIFDKSENTTDCNIFSTTSLPDTPPACQILVCVNYAKILHPAQSRTRLV